MVVLGKNKTFFLIGKTWLIQDESSENLFHYLIRHNLPFVKIPLPSIIFHSVVILSLHPEPLNQETEHKHDHLWNELHGIFSAGNLFSLCRDKTPSSNLDVFFGGFSRKYPEHLGLGIS